MTSGDVVRFGTRGSALARAQTERVIKRLNKVEPDLVCEVVIIQTEGDRDKETPLTVIGGRGVFTNALQDALRRGEIDVAVHSAKDLPTEETQDLTLAAFLDRADPRDVFISRHGVALAELGPNPVIGTSSRRRQMQVRKLRPDARLVDLRGNIDTRLRKAFETEIDGIVLAAAGLERMGWSERVTEYLPLDVAVPSPGQGALAVEIRTEEEGPARLLARLNEPRVSVAVRAERAFLRGMGGGCTSPVGAHAIGEGTKLRLRAMLGSADMTVTEWINVPLPLGSSESDAENAAKELLARVESIAAHQSGKLPLYGKRVLVTRGVPNDPLVEGLRVLGAEVLTAPLVETRPVDEGVLDGEIEGRFGAHYDWVVFTSVNAVDALLDRPSGAALLQGALVAAVGARTSARLQIRGTATSVVPRSFSASALVDELVKHDIRGKRVLFPRGTRAQSTLPDGLRAAGAVVDEIDVYATDGAEGIKREIVDELVRGPIDAIVFSSPSSVEVLTTVVDREILGGAEVACIGPTTAAAARAAGLKVAIVPGQSTIEALVEEIRNHFAIEHDVAIPVSAGGAGRGDKSDER